nr:hypothetical protein [uncultured Desulfuromonas sp.]
MKLFEQLAAAIRKEHEQGELPDYLVAPLQRVVENAENHRDQAELVGQLTEQLSELDPYSDCGCFGEGYTVSDLITTLKKLGIEVTGSTPPSCTLS